ncbi:MAG TPA: T9SS type A sorting domain-containing protein, partial [bacterium]
VLVRSVSKTYSYTPADDVSPQLQYVKLQNSTLLELVFSEPVEQASAERTTNYSIDPNVEVLNATLDPSQNRTVILETTNHIPGFQYGIYVRNIKDRATVPNVIQPNPSYMSYAPVGFGQSVDNDNIPPTLAKVNVLSTTQMEVYFSETVEKATAENKANYVIQDSIVVQSAKLDTSLAKVLLTTTPHRSGKSYRIQVSAVKDRATRANTLASSQSIKYLYSKGLSISNPSPSTSSLQLVQIGKACYADRSNWTFQQLPEVLANAVQVLTQNNDKTATASSYLKFDMRGSATVYVAYDRRIAQVPVWLSTWKATGDQIVDSRSNVFAVYMKKSMGGRFVLGGNSGSADDNMYMVFVVPQSGALLAEMNKASYSVAQVSVGDTYYIDRPYSVSAIPDSLNGLLWIKTAKDDNTNSEPDFLQLSLVENTRLYLAVDSRMAPLPDWMSGWNREQGQIVDSRGDRFNVLSKNCSAGDMVLGGNSGIPEDNMYVVLLAPSNTEVTGTVSELPGYFTLHQNYPNPFNPKTAIPYKVHKNGRLKITVFNIIGQTVKVLVDQDFIAGYEDEVVWDATDQNGLTVASGIYLYRIEQGQFARTRRMMLLR